MLETVEAVIHSRQHAAASVSKPLPRGVAKVKDVPFALCKIAVAHLTKVRIEYLQNMADANATAAR
eukprot:14742133-Alexandrium_andersonii.AAC.1